MGDNHGAERSSEVARLSKPTSRLVTKHGTMSALGQKRTFGCGPAMSALPSTADMLRAAINVRYVPS